MGHKIVVDPKKVMSATFNKEAPTLEQLAEVEQNILDMLRKVEEELCAKQGDDREQDEA